MASLPPLSYASSIIGIISFIFTLSIFASTFSQAWETVLSAPNQIRDFLGNLREELYEEKEALKRARSRPHGYRLKVLDESIKDLLREFRRLERPFLSTRARRRATPAGDAAEKGQPDVDEDFKPQVPGFYECDWQRRVTWLQTKPAIVRMATALDRIQTRRIERELSDVHHIVHSLDVVLRDLDDRLWGIEDRLRISHVSVAQRSGSRHGDRL